MLMFGIVLSSGAMKSVLYTSGTVWSALLAYFLLKKKLNWLQITGMIVVVVGLYCKGYKSFEEMKKADGAAGGMNQLLGALIIIAGTVLHSLTNVVNQKLLTAVVQEEITEIVVDEATGAEREVGTGKFRERKVEKIEPESLCHIIGFWSLLAYVLYVCLFCAKDGYFTTLTYYAVLDGKGLYA